MSGWANSTRRSRLPKDWPALVERVRQRAQGKCQAAQHEADCDGRGRECDHIRSGDDHSLDNLQWLSTPCHKAKTAAERPTRKRQARRHPGG